MLQLCIGDETDSLDDRYCPIRPIFLLVAIHQGIPETVEQHAPQTPGGRGPAIPAVPAGGPAGEISFYSS